MYKCAICGKEHEELVNRIECETKCLKELKEAEAELKKAEYENRRIESAEEINEALHEVDQMLKAHMKEFKSFALSANYPHLKYIFNHSFWWI